MGEKPGTCQDYHIGMKTSAVGCSGWEVPMVLHDHRDPPYFPDWIASREGSQYPSWQLKRKTPSVRLPFTGNIAVRNSQMHLHELVVFALHDTIDDTI